MTKTDLDLKDKVAISAVISVGAKRRMQNAGGGNFTKGIEVCAKNFAPYARGTHNFDSAESIFNEELIGKSVSDCVSLWLSRGYWLPNLLCYLAQEFSNGNLTIDEYLNIDKPADLK